MEAIKFFKIIFKLFQWVSTFIVSFLLLAELYIYIEKINVCKPQHYMAFGKNIQFPITINEAMNIYKLNYLEYSANSDVNKDTVMVVVSDYRFNNWQGDSINKPSKNKLDFNAQAYVFHFKNPTKQSTQNLKIYLEKNFDKKFEDRKFKYSSTNKHFYYMKLNNCFQISLNPESNLAASFYNKPNNNIKTCAVIFYFNVSEEDVDNGAEGSGRMKDVVGLFQ